jgi:N-acetylglucosaminyldiphosphoundecaprenol N-acetyl-beta-D-mannosaminyltransferase
MPREVDMNSWLNEHLSDTSSASRPPVARSALYALRALDMALATILLGVLALPLALALLAGRRVHRPMQGRNGAVFVLSKLEFEPSWWGRRWYAVGAANWLCLFNLIRGDMAFVGPRARPEGEPVTPATLSVRPGLANPWYLRQRTAVDFGSEPQADAFYLAQKGFRHDVGLLLRATALSLLSTPSLHTPTCVHVGDVVFDNLSMVEALSRLRVMLAGQHAKHVAFVNPHCVNIAARQRAYRRSLARAHLVLPDGIGIKIASSILGQPLKQNVNGTDLFPRLCEAMEKDGKSIFFLGGEPGVAEAVARRVTNLWPSLRVVGVRNGYFGPDEEGEVVAQVRASKADLLLVARGVPVQDLFISRHLPMLGVKVAMGVGGLFDFVSGRTPRAPVWMRESGLEWVYRLMQEPGRMWRRYLLGNVSFMLRVTLQACGIRRSSHEHPVRLEEDDGKQQPLRTVIFATAPVPADFPLPSDHPAALVPLGTKTLIEHVMDNLMTAGVRDLDLVVSDRPELLRALLGNGDRWGLQIRWHLSKDPTRPYSFLQTPSLQRAERLLIGHAHVCPGTDILSSLLQADGLPMQAHQNEGMRWTAWASTPPSRLLKLGHDLDETSLGMALRMGNLPVRVASSQQVQRVTSAGQLIDASFGTGSQEPVVPASWIRQPWGAMSPLAKLHPLATVVGPALIGPGCVIESGVHIGPKVVLTRDVVVAERTRLEHTVVLDGTFIGADLELRGAVVKGPRIRHIRLGVESVTAQGDALLMDLRSSARRRPSPLSRLLALGALVPIGPVLFARGLWLRVRGRSPDWISHPVVLGRDPISLKLVTAQLRCGYAAGMLGVSVWARMAALVDVLNGQRSWMGMRPRTASQWYALRPEWQSILASEPVGVFHAPAWSVEGSLDQEACDAADVYLAVQPRWRRFAFLTAAVWASARRRSAVPKPECFRPGEARRPSV